MPKDKTFWDTIQNYYGDKKEYFCRYCDSKMRMGDIGGSMICDKCQSMTHWSHCVERGVDGADTGKNKS